MAIGRHSSIVDTYTYLPTYLHPSYFILRGRPYKETVTDAMYLYLQIKPFHTYTYIYDPTPLHLTYDTLQQTGKCLSVDSTGRRRMVRDTPLMTSIHATNESEGLRGYMGQFGEIDSSTIMRDPSGRSRGFAFLTYSNVSSVDKVMGQVHHLDGKQASWV